MKILKIVILLISISYFGLSQKPSLEFKAKYQQARADLKNQKFEIAKNQFLSLKNSANNSLSPYIDYYLALSQHKLKQFNEAEKTLIQLQAKFPTWANNEDFNYIFGVNYLKKSELESALNQFNKIKKTEFDTKIEGQLSQDIFREKIILNSKIYIDKYQNISCLKTITKQNEALNKYGLDSKNLPKLLQKTNLFASNNTINIGVLLPFRTDSLKQITNNNQYAFDLYSGMEMASKKLKNEGIDVKLHLYDMGNEKEKMIGLLNNKKFNEEQLLIGPLHAESNKIAQYYANELKIPLVNPLSKNGNLITGKSYCFLASENMEAFNNQAINFIQSNFYGDVAILHNGQPEEIENATQQTNILTKKNIKNIVLKFTSTESLNVLKNKKTAAILWNGSPNNFTNLITSIDKKLGIVPTIINARSLPDNLSLSDSQTQELYIFNQNFVDENSEAILNFKTEYWNLKNSIPSEYTYKGYDLLLFWGRNLSKYKENTADFVKFKAIDEDYLLSGFNYGVVPKTNAAFTITSIQKGTQVLYKKL